MNPHRTHAEHKLHFVGERPRLLEQKIGIPFGRVVGETCRDTSFKFQPVFNGRDFNRHRGTDARLAVLEIPAWSDPKLDDCDRLFLDRLRENSARAEEYGCDEDGCARHAFTTMLNRKTRLQFLTAACLAVTIRFLAATAISVRSFKLIFRWQSRQNRKGRSISRFSEGLAVRLNQRARAVRVG